MQFKTLTAFALATFGLVAAVPLSPRAKSGSQLLAFAEKNCTGAVLINATDIPGDGIFGTDCVSAPVHTEAIGRDLAQGYSTVGLVEGCTAYVYSTPDCTGNSLFDVTGQYDNVCFNNDRTDPNVPWEIESAKIVCSN